MDERNSCRERAPETRRGLRVEPGRSPCGREANPRVSPRSSTHVGGPVGVHQTAAHCDRRTGIRSRARRDAGAVTAARPTRSATDDIGGTIVAVDFSHWGGPARARLRHEQSQRICALSGRIQQRGDVHDGPAFACRIGNEAFRHGTESRLPPKTYPDPARGTAYWSISGRGRGESRWSTAQGSRERVDEPKPGEVELWTSAAPTRWHDRFGSGRTSVPTPSAPATRHLPARTRSRPPQRVARTGHEPDAKPGTDPAGQRRGPSSTAATGNDRVAGTTPPADFGRPRKDDRHSDHDRCTNRTSPSTTASYGWRIHPILGGAPRIVAALPRYRNTNRRGRSRPSSSGSDWSRSWVPAPRGRCCADGIDARGPGSHDRRDACVTRSATIVGSRACFTRSRGGSGRSGSRSRRTARRTAAAALVLAVLGFVVVNRRTEAPWARAFKYYLCLASGRDRDPRRVPVDLRLGHHAGEHVLFRLPADPDCRVGMSGVRLGGPVSLEATLSAAVDGLRLGTLHVLHRRRQRARQPEAARCGCCPARCTSSASRSSSSISVAPQLVESVQRVRRAPAGCGRAEQGPPRVAQHRDAGAGGRARTVAACSPPRWTRAATAAPDRRRARSAPDRRRVLMLVGHARSVRGGVRAARRDRAALPRPARDPRGRALCCAGLVLGGRRVHAQPVPARPVARAGVDRRGLRRHDRGARCTSSTQLQRRRAQPVVLSAALPGAAARARPIAILHRRDRRRSPRRRPAIRTAPVRHRPRAAPIHDADGSTTARADTSATPVPA